MTNLDVYPKYLILKARVVVCFGVPGSVVEWDVWATFDNAKVRDMAHYRLSMENPDWRLKTEDRMFSEQITARF